MRRWTVIAAVVCIALAATGLVTFRPVAAAPAFDAVHAAYCPSDIRLLDRHGTVLQELRVDAHGRRLAWTPLAAVSPALTDALLASEDRRFSAHHGVDWHAVAAAFWQRLRGGPPRGASTITMQVAALLDPALRRGDAPRTLPEKWRQMRAAWALERTWTKPQILEAYLNLVTFRGELQGIGAAADVLFGKAPHGLTAAESAVLVASVRAPNARATTGASTADARHSAGPRVTLAPHAARRLLPQIGPPPCGDTASTLDAEIQRAAIDSLRRHLLAIRDRSARDAAVLVADNDSGDVLAYVGGSGGDLSSAAHVDGILAPRQAGSTLKPFLYALALDRHLLTAASLLDDSPLEIAAGNGLFRPRDYDECFRGPVSVRSALAGSLNVPAVRALLLVGPDTLADTLRGLGLAGVCQPGDYYGPALALGAADVTLWQLVTAYRALANGGVVTPLHLRPGDAAPAAQRVFSRAAAFVVGDVLADRDGRSVTFGLENPLGTPFWTAVKTGTSKDMRDNWCIGFSRRYTVGVWVGNFSGEPMHDVSGITGAAPIWEEVMTRLHRDVPSEAPLPPPDVRAVPTVFVDGAEPPRREWYLAGTEPVQADAHGAALARILAPTDQSIIALDPDIAARRQRVAFIAQTTGGDARWRLDGIDLGAARGTTLWQPVPGSHALLLVDGASQPLGAVHFEVRGRDTAVAAPAPID